jgi:FkbM family methyltransferase
MKRFLKQHFRHFLPGGIRRFLKRHLEARFHRPTTTVLKMEETESALRCTIDNSWSFLVPPARRADLAHLRDGGELGPIVEAAMGGGVLFDIGAHSGLISALFCAGHADNQAVSFEPSPVLVERLSNIRELNQFGERMRIERIGIGETSTTTEMLLDPTSGFIQTQRFDHTMWGAPEVVQIPMERIADAASRLDLIPQYIKLDIESYELEAIKGSLEFLSRHKPTIFLELHLDYLEQRHLSAKLVIEMLEECGYVFSTSSGSRLNARTLYDSSLSNIHVVAR